MNTPPSSFLTVLRANEGLMVAFALCIAPIIVLTVIGFIVRSAGGSLRPIVFLAVLMLPIIAIFLIGQLVRARLPAPAVPAPALAVRDGRFVDREKLFGSDIPAELIREAKSGLGSILDEAEVAEVGVNTSGETVLIAQFPGEEQTKRAAAAYHHAYQLRNTSGDEENGWRATRVQGDYIEMLRTGRQLFVWSGLTKEAAATRRAASNFTTLIPSLKAAPRPPLFPALQPLADFFAPLSMKLIGLVFLVFIYSLWFFKGAGWASSARAEAGASIVSVSELTSRLLAINKLDVPFVISQSSTPSELQADWRYADAKWIDLARAHGMRRTFRIHLTLDESSHTVRATDYSAAFDWSAGHGGGSIAWRAETGIIFFQKEQQHVFGLQFDDQGRPQSGLAYSYKFDLNEMKGPIMTTVTKAGWNWRPTVWRGPAWLRWLTE